MCYISFIQSYPVSLSELLTVYYPSEKRRSISDTKTFRIHPPPPPPPHTHTHTHTNWTKGFFPTQWNSLLYNVCYSASSFKQALKIHPFRSTYKIKSHHPHQCVCMGGGGVPFSAVCVYFHHARWIPPFTPFLRSRNFSSSVVFVLFCLFVVVVV